METKVVNFNGGRIERRVISRPVYIRQGRNKGWRDRTVVCWVAYDRNGNFLRSKDKGRTLRGAKAAITRAHE